MTKQRFRSLPLREAPGRVDRDKRVIYGVSAAQAVEALGHGLELDQRTIEQIVELGNKTKNGIKSRFTHPGLSSDGMGKHLGRMVNFRVEGDKAVGDLRLAEAASNAPDGDLAGYVMDLANEDSAAFGMSIVAGGELVWTRANGEEQNVGAVDATGEPLGRPDDALTELPVFRVTELDAVDVVDEPAANRDGMFSAHLWGTNVKAEQFFGDFDNVLTQMGMSPQQAWNYALRYFEARQVDLKGLTMSDEQQAVVDPTETEEEIVVTVEIESEDSADAQEGGVTQEEFAKLNAKLEAMAAEKLAEQQEKLELAAKVEAMEREARKGRFEALARSWQGEFAAHMTILEALGEGSEAFSVYKTLMSALSEQVEQGGLFKEMGSNSREPMGATAVERVNKLAAQRATETGITLGEAMQQVFQEQPALYDEYRGEVEAN